MTPTDIGGIVAWYASHVNGDWEHDHEIRIVSLDNPGWSVSIPIEGTELGSKPFDEVNEDRSSENWMRCWRTDTTWEAACGPLNLANAMAYFDRWSAG